MRGMFHFSAPKSAVDNSSTLTRSLQLSEEARAAQPVSADSMLWLQVEVAEQQRFLLRELKTAPVLENKPLDVQSSVERERVRDKRGSKVAHFKWPTDPLWSRQWSLVISYLITGGNTNIPLLPVQCGSEWREVGAGCEGSASLDTRLHWQRSGGQHCG